MTRFALIRILENDLPPMQCATRSLDNRRKGNRCRITVQLADARAGFNLWAESFAVDGPLEHAQEQAVMAVIVRLEPRLHRAIYDTVRANRVQPTARSLYLEVVVSR